MDTNKIDIPYIQKYEHELTMNEDVSVYDSNIFSIRQYNKYLNIINDVTHKLGETFYNINDILTIKRHLSHTHPLSIGSLSGNRFIDIKKRLYNLTEDGNLSVLSKKDTDIILSYKFVHFLSLDCYMIVRDMELLKKKNNVFVISKNVYLLDGIICYMKNHLLNYDPKLVTYYLYLENIKQSNNYDNEYLKNNNINPLYIKNGLNKQVFDNINKTNDTLYDLFIIDVNIYIKTLIIGRSSYGFQELLAIIIYGIKKINIGGNIIICSPYIHQKAIINFYIYLRTFFKNIIIKTSDFTYYTDILIYIICEEYKGIDNINKLENVHNELYRNDNTGGYNFSFNKTEYDLFNKYTDHSYNEYNKIASIVKIKETSTVKKFYTNYKNLLIEKYINHTRYINDIYTYYINRNDINYTKKILKENINLAISYAIKKKLSMDKWVDTENIDKIIYEQSIRNFYEQIHSIKSNIVTESKYIIGNYKHIKNGCNVDVIITDYNIKCNRCKPLLKLVNNYETKFDKNIKHNNKNIHNNWIEIKEILDEINILNDTNDKSINILYIDSNNTNIEEYMKYYIDNNKMIPNYTHTTVKYTTDINYYEKYRNTVDILICDYNIINGDNMILILGLILVKNNGNIMIESNINNDMQYLSILYIIHKIYNKVYIYKPVRFVPNTKYYIIGIGKRSLVITEINNLQYILKKMSDGIKIYPVNEIDNKFCEQYRIVKQKILNNNITFNDFYNYVSNNKNKESIKYLKKMIEHYKKYIITKQ